MRSQLIIAATLPVLLALICHSTKGAAYEVTVPQGRTLYIQIDHFAAFFNDDAENSNIAGGIGYAGRLGWRKEKWGVFAQFERDFWMVSEVDLDLVNGVLNFAAGAERLSFKDRVRSSIAFGTSTLMFDTVFDEAGATGLFLDIRPISLRWPVHRKVTLEVSPLSVTLLAPVLRDPGIRKIEYRTVLTLEVSL